MVIEPRPDLSRAPDGATRLLARAAVAEASARRLAAATVADIFVPAAARVDDRERAAIAATFTTLVGAVEAALREHGGRLLHGRGELALGALLGRSGGAIAARLWHAGLPRDVDFMRELMARVRLDLLSESLPDATPDDPDRPSLLPRLTEHPDPIVAASATAVMVADNRHRALDQGGRGDLPAELHYKLTWWTAAALRDLHAADGAPATLDRALAEAAQRHLGAQDEGERLEAAVMRLAVALDPAATELSDLLIEALGDRRAAVFVALLAHALHLSFDVVRAIVVDAGGERLWLCCRALDLPRETIAQIGSRLADGDAHRNLEQFADELDEIAAIPVETARAAIAPLRLNADYGAALDALRRHP